MLVTTRVSIRSCLAVICVAVATLPALAVAQTRIPTRIDGTWNWRHHEPRPAHVHRAERGVRVVPPPGQRQATTAEVEGLYQHLMRRSPF